MLITRRRVLGQALGVAALGAASKAIGQVGGKHTRTIGLGVAAWPRLIAHWKLDRDCRDAVGGHDGEGHGVKFVEGYDGKPEGAALFNGVDAFIKVEDGPDWRFGTHEFSIATWVNLKQDLDSVIGDILTKFDSRYRSGFTLSIEGSSAGYSSVGDAKNVLFGIDHGICGSWMECGKPCESNAMIASIAVYKGQLYTGLGDAARPEDACHVFRYAGETNWVDCGRLGTNLLTTTVESMIVHRGQLFCGTGVYDWRKMEAGIGGPAHVYSYEGDKQWRDLGRVGHAYFIQSLASFKGDLYTGDDHGECYRWNGGKSWTFCGRLGNDNWVQAFMVFKGSLYSSSLRGVYRYEGGTTWASISRYPLGSTQIHKLQVYDSHLYVGTWPEGTVGRYEGEGRWTDCGQLGIAPKYGINEVNTLRVYNGKLYAGVLPKAQLYRYESGKEWTMLRQLVYNPEFSPQSADYGSRIPSATVFQGKLFHGTSTCVGNYDPPTPPEAGRVYAMEAGKCVTYDDDLGSGWKHLVAVRERDYLKLYINGKLAVTSAHFNGEDYNVTSRDPLLIGRGAQNNFSGTLDNIRFYEGALSSDQILDLYQRGGE